MPDDVILLWLDGPMQSWGTRSRWDVRDTGLEPTKSGIVGMIGAALGLHRGHPRLEELDRSLRFGVRVDVPGVVATDYHTATGYHRTAGGGFKHRNGVASSLKTALEHEPATIVSPRDYLHDAVFLVALQGEQDLIFEVRSALGNPVWPLFLGRKSCPPASPVLEQCVLSYPDAETALRLHPRRVPRRRAMNKSAGPLVAYIEDPKGSLERQDSIRINSLRMYEFRSCRILEDVDPPCTTLD